MLFDRLAEFQDGLEKLGIGGNDCAVYLDGKPVFRHFAGWQDRERGIRIDENTLYRMFSMTKPITCAAALQLFEQGRFLLSDPLSDYLPEFADMKVKLPAAFGEHTVVSARNPIRIQNLFEMTAGLDYDTNTPAIRELKEATGCRFTTREYAAALAKAPLNFEPGTHWLYSQAHDVLGALIEVVSGESFDAYLRSRVFTPLGIRTGWFHAPESEKTRLCRRYALDENGAWIIGPEENDLQPSPRFCSGGAGLVMTVDDYARFAVAMTNRGKALDGTRILNGRTVDLMRTPRLNEAEQKDFSDGETRWGYGYGLGVRTLIDAAAGGSLSFPGEFGWGGAWGTYVVMDPDAKVTIVYAEQGVDTRAPYIQRRVRNLAYAALEEAGLLETSGPSGAAKR